MSATDPVALLIRARAEGVAVAAVNAIDLETAEAVVAGAEAANAPVILQISQNAVRYASLSRLAAIGRVLRDEAAVPVVLHFDHAEGVEVAEAALRAGFDSVMLEGADRAFDEHLRAVKRLARAARAAGAGVEAELEVVPKGERGRGAHVPPELLARFADDSGCTSLAVDLGTQHKQRATGTRLDLERLADVTAAVRLPIVLHGGSGVSDDELAVAAARGVSKVNLATALMVVFTREVRARLEEPEVVDARAYLGPGRAAMADRVAHYLRVLGAQRLRV